MSLVCSIFGHDSIPTGNKTDNGEYEVKCELCGQADSWPGKMVCQKHDCEDYVIGINYLHSQHKKRDYSQRCYRCPRCNDAWSDSDEDLLDGPWHAVRGKAIHATEVTEEDETFWMKLEKAKSIKEVKKIMNERQNNG